ncbi:MAG: hypothetical protein JOZ80_08215 [Acidobacteriaceae bacterium]|nr:hypothetical protein [Acidobacteriaceae bacterium]
MAETDFAEVKGGRAEDAKLYLRKIKNYRDAVTLAQNVLTRSSDELDLRSLDFAIQKCEEALSLKKDGPGAPAKLLQQAKSLEASLQQQSGETAEARDNRSCEKAVEAEIAKRFKEAAEYSCLLAGDNPRYSCAGDEAAHLCEQMRSMAQAPSPQSTPKRNKGEQQTRRDDAIAAYENNDFDRAIQLFRNLNGAGDSEADQYIEKIEKYTSLMRQARQSAKASKYDAARTAYLDAALLKANGPGEPKQQAMLMDLEQGLSEFYSGDYLKADGHLASYAQGGIRHRELAHFYLGASRIARYMLGGETDSALREEALNEFRMAKQQGFQPGNQDLSPKIMKIYEMNF